MHKEGWTKVSYSKCSGKDGTLSRMRKESKCCTNVVTSMYVSEFPEEYTARKLFELFGCSKNVVEVAISPRSNKF